MTASRIIFSAHRSNKHRTVFMASCLTSKAVLAFVNTWCNFANGQNQPRVELRKEKNQIHWFQFMLATALTLVAAPTAWAYDSAINGGIGVYVLDYQDQAQSLKGNTSGFRLGYVGTFNDYLGFDVRIGGAGKTSTAGLTIQPGGFLSLLFRPSLPVSETVNLYGLIGMTSLAVGRTSIVNNTEQVIARVGTSFGVGVDFHINKHFVTGVELVSYQRKVDFGPRGNGSSSDNWTGVTRANVSLSSLTANLKYQF